MVCSFVLNYIILKPCQNHIENTCFLQKNLSDAYIEPDQAVFVYALTVLTVVDDAKPVRFRGPVHVFGLLLTHGLDVLIVFVFEMDEPAGNPVRVDF